MKRNIAIGLFFAVASCSGTGTPAFDKNYEPSGNLDVDAWYAKAQRNPVNDQTDSGGSCCGKADAYWSQLTRVETEGVWITVDDNREIPGRIVRDGKEFFVSNDILDRLRQGNPTGHIVLFVGVSDGKPICLFMGEGI